jgi:predicted transcriptional regulator
MRRREKIGQAQLEVLRYVQDHHPVTVRQVAEFLAETRGLTRTTALNVMERLRDKGHLSRALVDGVYHYSPIQSKPQLLRGLVRDFVDQALGGSLEPFVAYLAEEVDLSAEELERLQQRVRELKQEEDARAGRPAEDPS